MVLINKAAVTLERGLFGGSSHGPRKEKGSPQLSKRNRVGFETFAPLISRDWLKVYVITR